MQSRLRLFQGKDLEQVHRERERLQEEYQAQDRLLEETVRSCRCRTMARLAELQRDYGRKAEELLQTGLAAGQQDFGSSGRDRAEAAFFSVWASMCMCRLPSLSMFTLKSSLVIPGAATSKV